MRKVRRRKSRDDCTMRERVKERVKVWAGSEGEVGWSSCVELSAERRSRHDCVAAQSKVKT